MDLFLNDLVKLVVPSSEIWIIERKKIHKHIFEPNFFAKFAFSLLFFACIFGSSSFEIQRQIWAIHKYEKIPR
jgi:hypothetical protein